MKWISRFSALMFGLLTLGVVKDFFDKNRILVISNDSDDFEFDESNKVHVDSLKPENYDNAIDMRGTPVHVCFCGCNIWNVKTIFDNNEIATYFLDMECANCGSLATAPTPIDVNGMEQ
jgi:hypothetical protein